MPGEEIASSSPLASAAFAYLFLDFFMSLRKLPNLGPRSEQMLQDAGIDSFDDLKALGPVISFLAVKQTGANPSLNLMWAIFGALNEIPWTDVSEEQKSALIAELNEATKWE